MRWESKRTGKVISERTGEGTGEGAGGLINMSLSFNTRCQHQKKLRTQPTWGVRSKTNPRIKMQPVTVATSVMV